MKKLGRLKLNFLSENELCYREMNALRGGSETDGCRCYCCLAQYDSNQEYINAQEKVGTRDKDGDLILCSCKCGCGDCSSDLSGGMTMGFTGAGAERG